MSLHPSTGLTIACSVLLLTCGCRARPRLTAASGPDGPPSLGPIPSLATQAVRRDYEPFIRDVLAGRQQMRGAMVLLSDDEGRWDRAVADLKRLKAYGANHVRLYFAPHVGLTGAERKRYHPWIRFSNTTRPDDRWLGITGEVVKRRWLPLFAELDLPVVLMLFQPEHTSKSATAPMWTDPAARQRLVDECVAQVKFFQDCPGIIGFDLLNEPVPPGCRNRPNGRHWWTWSADDARADAPDGDRALATIYNDVIRRVRRFDRDRMIVLEPGPWGLGWAFPALRHVVDDPRLVFSFHQYTPLGWTHWGREAWDALDATRFPTTRPAYPDARRGWTRATIAESYAPAAAFRQAREKQTGRFCPIWVGEFGTWRWLDGPSQLRWYRDTLELLEEHKFGWAYFVYDAGLNMWWSCMTQDGPDGDALDAAGFLRARKTSDVSYFLTLRRQVRPSFQVVIDFMKKNQP